MFDDMNSHVKWTKDDIDWGVKEWNLRAIDNS